MSENEAKYYRVTSRQDPSGTLYKAVMTDSEDYAVFCAGWFWDNGGRGITIEHLDSDSKLIIKYNWVPEID